MVGSRLVASPRGPVTLVHVHLDGGNEELFAAEEILVLELVFITILGEGPLADGNSAICDSSHDVVINK